MPKSCLFITGTIFSLIFSINGWSQTVDIIGVVDGNGDIENIHVINKSSKMFTTTNALGAFRISAKYKDTIQFTSVRYKTATIVVSYKTIQEKRLKVYLEELINVLDEVIVGKVLTGDLDSDIENSDAERPINFYDLGLPGYTGEPLTQSERRLEEARSVQPGMIPLLPLINAISGRTKMLKKRVILERITVLTEDIKARLSKDFFNTYPINEKFRKEFFYFCSEDLNFENRCKNKSDIEVYEFLAEKYVEFTKNLKIRED